MLILLDSDPIVYRAGFAAEKSSYNIWYNRPGSSTPELRRFTPNDNRTAGDKMKAWLAKHPDHEIIDKEKTTQPESIAHCLEMVDTQISSIIRDVEYKYCPATITVVPVLSGPGNFREKLGTIRPYKGNRDTLHKPYHYQAIRNHLCDKYAAVVTSGCEADDWISIEARANHCGPNPVVIATIDKDLDQIPGTHYNYMKRVHYSISKNEAIRFFYCQALAGDPTDGIPGCYKIAMARAEKIINPVVGNELSLWTAVLNEYALSQNKSGCPYALMDFHDVALETARLVKLQEYPNQLWNPPGVPDERTN